MCDLGRPWNLPDRAETRARASFSLIHPITKKLPKWNPKAPILYINTPGEIGILKWPFWGASGRFAVGSWPLFPRTLCPLSPDPSEARRKKRVLHVFLKWPDWQLTQISLNGSEKSRTVCPKTKSKNYGSLGTVFLRAFAKNETFFSAVK